MSTDGGREPRENGGGLPAAPAKRPPGPREPSEPAAARPAPAPPLAGWLHTPRPPAPPGVWRFGHRPRPAEAPDPTSSRELYGGALLALLTGLLVWSLGRNGYIDLWKWPLERLPVKEWSVGEAGTGGQRLAGTLVRVNEVLWSVLLAYAVARIGDFPRAWRRLRPTVLRWLPGLDPGTEPLPARAAGRAVAALLAAALAWELSFRGTWEFWLWPFYRLVPDGWWENGDTGAYVVAYNVHYVLWTLVLLALAAWAGGWRRVVRHYRADRGAARTAEVDLARWQQLRDGGAVPAAERLTAELADGALSDLDYARIDRAWQGVRARPTALEPFCAAVLAEGAAAFAHPSGDRDLPVRTARHDLLTRQVLIGRAVDDDRNPYAHRGVAAALEPATLGTSLLAVGPPGSGKTGRVIRPVTEALCLQALTGQATVVAVGSAATALGPDGAFDVIVRIGDPASSHRLDLYGGADSTDEAAALLAEALLGTTRTEPGEAAAALAQLIGPYRAAYGHFPGVPELRALLDGAPALLATLAEDLDHAGAWDQQRELAARARQAQRPEDVGRLLADRLAVLDRAGFATAPAGAASAGPDGRAGRRTRPFALAAALEHPLRVRVDLPPAGHAEAGRIITRLLLAQFTAAASARGDRSLFAGLVLDDATAAITPGTVRGLTHLRPANAGAVLALRTLDEVPERLRTGLLGAVGCRMAFSGITTWDGEHFARAWGKEWTEDRDVTRSPDRHGGVLRRSVRGVRKLFTGRDATTETVTVRRVERERWSASELAHRLPPRHAVLSLTTAGGEAGPPVLIKLDS